MRLEKIKNYLASIDSDNPTIVDLRWCVEEIYRLREKVAVLQSDGWTRNYGRVT
jgi:hypothetical protein